MIRQRFPLGFQWPTQEPFLFCVHHLDDYPIGDGKLGVAPSRLGGRALGSDFEPRDGFRMYHGETVPGFPAHPHRGFETVTIVRRGFVDHADSMGAAGRYGDGDVQWMTAGRGVQHSEMFPLLRDDAGNPVELFQIWLNLPRARKMTDPDFQMLWSERIPVVTEGGARVTVIAGALAGVEPPAPPAASWATDPASGTAIWLVKLDPGAEYTLPAAAAGVNRALYFFGGDALEAAGERLPPRTGLFLDGAAELRLRAGARAAEALVLQSRPIGEPVVQYGPFVMNTEGEIRQTFTEYQRTRFGGWPWERNDMVHGPLERGRFARHPDGREELPPA